MPTKKLIVANWKQNKTLNEAIHWCQDFIELMEIFYDTREKKDSMLRTYPETVICPSFVHTRQVSTLLSKFDRFKISCGVQDISPFDDGAHTGNVGINQLKGFVDYAIVGHSERQEDREVVAQKASMCLHAGIAPIVCFKSPEQYKKIEGAIYALEDPENISRGGAYRPKALTEVEELTGEARTFFGKESKIIYGGSVNEQNAGELASIAGLDGVLVGNASLNPSTFCVIVNKFSI